MLQINLARRGRQQIGTAHDMRDALKCIVDYHSELIREQAIRALHHEIANFVFEVLRNAALQYIVEFNRGRRKAGEDGARSVRTRHADSRADSFLFCRG